MFGQRDFIVRGCVIKPSQLILGRANRLLCTAVRMRPIFPFEHLFAFQHIGQSCWHVANFVSCCLFMPFKYLLILSGARRFGQVIALAKRSDTVSARSESDKSQSEETASAEAHSAITCALGRRAPVPLSNYDTVERSTPIRRASSDWDRPLSLSAFTSRCRNASARERLSIFVNICLY